jgi:hypothetical protein
MSETSLDALWWLGVGLSLTVVVLVIWISSE